MSTVEQPDLVAVGQRGWEPGPSFVDVGTTDLDYEGIPGWLQSFGESVTDSAPLPAAENAFSAAAPASADSAAPSLPSWLEEPRPAPAAPPPSTSLLGDLVSEEDTNGFLSEDDLPEWLRTIGGDAESTISEEGELAPTTANGAIHAPSIALAWVAIHQMVSLEPGETLFARIAVEEITLAANIQSDATQVWDAAVARPSVDQLSPAAESASEKPRLRPVLLLAVAIVLVLLVLIFLNQR